MSSAATIGVEEVAELLGVSTWALYSSVRKGALPPGLEPLRVGRLLRWPTAAVERALGLEATKSGGS